MSGYTKLFSSILGSTVWREDPPTKCVWVTMLAMADQDGIVEASVPGLAHFSGVSVEQAEAAVAKFLSADPHSRSPENEGRRIEPVDGGWRLLNHFKYRFKMSPEDRKEKARIRQQRHREQQNVTHKRDASVTERDDRDESRESRHTDTDTDADTKADEESQNPSAHPSAEPGKAVSRDVRLSNSNLSTLAAEIYGEYPRKVGKQDAINAIEKSITTVSRRAATENHEAFNGDLNLAAGWLKSRTTLYAASPQGQRKDREHIPYPATWFNGARYDDDAAEWNHVDRVSSTWTKPTAQAIPMRSASSEMQRQLREG